MIPRIVFRQNFSVRTLEIMPQAIAMMPPITPKNIVRLPNTDKIAAKREREEYQSCGTRGGSLVS